VNRQQRRAAAKQPHTSGPARPQFVDDGWRHHQAGRLNQAGALYLKALAVQPNDAYALNLLGVLRCEHGSFLEAVGLITKAIAVKPNFPEALNNLGLALGGLTRYEEALASYDRALAIKPDFAEVLNNRGNALHELKRYEEALASYDRALAIKPDYAYAFYNRGNALLGLGRPAGAEKSYREALALRPNYPEAHSNLGHTLSALGRAAEAVASCREALRLRPDFADAHNNLCLALLSTGQYDEGWKEHEWRWKTKHLSEGARDFSAPRWGGEAIGDRVILLHAEQGLGDTLQFCRYVPLVASVARVVLEVQAPLVRLLSQLPAIEKIIARGDKLPPFDLQCPLLSLPRAFGTTLDTIPAATPYLAADPELAADWRERLARLDRLRVGLVWAGEKRLHPELAAVDHRRSVALDTMAPLGEASGVSFISLQKGEPATQTANPPHGMELHDFTADLHDFADTAALIDGLDLVISVDTSVAHLAGALGKPVWLLNRFDTCWRWLLNRDDSPWYPQLRQFRQPAPGDWNSVIRAVRYALQRLAAGDRDQLRPRQATI